MTEKSWMGVNLRTSCDKVALLQKQQQMDLSLEGGGRSSSLSFSKLFQFHSKQKSLIAKDLLVKSLHKLLLLFCCSCYYFYYCARSLSSGFEGRSGYQT